MLSEPHWLILLFPLLCLVFIYRPDSKILLSARILLIILLCLALASPIVKLKGQEGVVIVVADRSSSMPSDTDKRIQETTSILSESMPINSKLGLVSFNERARIEFSPTKNDIPALSETNNPDASNLADGIELALSLIPDGLSGRILVLSDGMWNGSDPQGAAINAINRNIPIDFRHIGNGSLNDLAVSYLSIPNILEPEEPFILRAGIVSPLKQDVQIELFNGDKLIFKTNYLVNTGLNEVNFSLKAPSSSVAKYIFKISSINKDPQPKNNVAQAVALIKGKKPILIISDNDSSTMKMLLDKNKIYCQFKGPKEFSWRLEDLTGYSAVVLENIPAEKLGFNGMHSLAAWVKHMGGGLLITGGKNSYGDGGYYQSPLDEALPVSLEMRSENRKMNIAIAVVMDRSGSMGMQVAGRTKMELADLAAASSLDLLLPEDEFGVFAVDTSPHLVVPLQKVSTKEKWRDQILSIRSMGGGIYVYEGINAAVEMLKNAQSQTRHIILFSDACDSEQPGEYWNLLADAKAHGMTLSVIGLGKESDPDGNLLKKIAAEGDGRCFFTSEPEDLPRLFSQDTFLAAKSTFVDKEVNIVSNNGLNAYISDNLNFKSSVNAYNICYLRENASQLITAEDDDKSPILAVWQYGLGKVACYTGVLSKEQGGKFLKSSNAPNVLCGICDWIAYDDRAALGELLVTQKIENGVWKAYLNLDPDRVRDPFTNTPIIEFLKTSFNGKPSHYTLKANWEDADKLSFAYDIKGNEVITSFLKINDKMNLVLPPICQIYSPEFLPEQNRNGANELKKISKMTGGNEVIDLNSVWSTMPLVYQDKNISNYLFVAALFLFLLEIAERRLALVSIIMSNLRKIGKGSKYNKPVERKVEVEPNIDKGITLTQTVSVNIPSNSFDKANETEKKEEQKDVLGALKKAKRIADRRNG